MNSPASPYARGTASTEAPIRVSMDALREHCAAVLTAAGLSEANANLVADSLVDAEVRGIGSHGVTRTRIYSERLRAGMIVADAVPTVVRENGSSAAVDAKNAIGIVGAKAGLDLAIAQAKEHYSSVVGVANSNHCGTLAYFTRHAAEQGLIAIAMSTAPQTMIYFGGKTRAVGTNPLSIAVPRPDASPIVVDMATSAVARGKIILANKLGQDIPGDWAVDAEGRPTTDAAAALLGSVVPFAGPKGSGLAMMIDLLAGAMVAGVSGPDIGDMYEDYTRTQRVSHLFILMNPEGWIGRDAFMEHVGVFAERVHNLPPADGVEQVILPGEIEQRRFEAAQRDGIALPFGVVEDLNTVAAEFGVNRTLASLD